MKKVILLLLVTVLLVGCAPLQKNSLATIVNNSIKSKLKLYDQYRSGYKYYLPKGLTIKAQRGFNEVLTNNRETYYLYVDAVSYYNRVVIDYEVDQKAYYSQVINYEDKFGYLVINQLNENKYIIEIMYNYAKIEVIVVENAIKQATANAINILSSVKFNDRIIANQIGDDINLFNESEYNIFETNSSDSIYLYYIETDQSDDNERDADLID